MNAITRRQDRGAVLIAVLIMAMVIAVFCMVSLMMSGTESRSANGAILRDQALFIAQAGIEDELLTISNLEAKATLTQPFVGIDCISGTTPIVARDFIADGVNMGEYTVSVDCVSVVDSMTRDIQITSTGYMPSASTANALKRVVTAVVRFQVGRSHVFDYVYFINNWGWFYGDSIYANGNVRANGQFDFGGHSATINGMPVYSSVSPTGVPGAQTDCGGVYSGWNIVNSGSLQGGTHGATNMHAWGDPVPMPNLTDLTAYETLAKNNNSSITVGSKVISPVVGDTTGEAPNLYLKGTSSSPIILNGPVVVRGNLVISGVVKGRGSIFVQGSIYVVGDITYASAPTTAPGSGSTATQLQSWYTTNQNADALGLFARQNIIIGDYTDSRWQSSVGSWMNSSSNVSDEDVGADGIPNTKAGKDGILGTADDDVLEDNSKWDVNYYKAGDALPAGKKVGDVINGSIEDIDGDGVNTPAVTTSNIALSTPLLLTNWSGNFPTLGFTSFSSMVGSTGNNISKLNAAFYTNHTIAMYSNSSNEVDFNGCIVSHNEDLIYSGSRVVFNYDPRLLLENSPFGLTLPMAWKAPQIMMWRSN